MSRDGEYHPFPSPPPPIVYGPSVYYDRGYPVRVPSEPARHYHQDGNSRRETWRREFNEWHDQNHRDYVNGKR